MASGFTYDEIREVLYRSLNEILTEGQWESFLRFAGNFRTYSANNNLLIYAQCIERGLNPTYLAGYSKWKTLGRSVRRGEKGIRIVVPVTRSRGVYRSDEPESDFVVVEPVESSGEQGPQVICGFRKAYVFDVSQTDGEPLEEPLVAKPLEGSGSALIKDGLIDILSSEGFRVVFEPLAEGVNGITDFFEGVVRISLSLSDRQVLKTLCHELAHAKLHRNFSGARSDAEAEAESFAFIMMSYLGYDSGEYSIPYLLWWTRGSLDHVMRGFESAYRLFGLVASELTHAFPDGAMEEDEFVLAAG